MILFVGISIFILTAIILILWHVETRIPKLNSSYHSEDEKYKNISSWFDKLREHKKFNGVVYYQKAEKVLINKCLGYLSSDQEGHIDTTTMFRLSSLSKQFTAFGIMLLEHKKNLSYDDLVIEYIHDFPYDQVSIRDLLNQTSVILVDYIKIAKKNKAKIKGRVLTNKDVIHLISDCYKSSHKAENKKYFYNNTNYIVLAYIIEIITNKSFENYMKDHVFNPLGLNRTRVWNLLSDTLNFEENNMARGFEAYLKSKPRQVNPGWIDGVAGDGAIFSCIEDLKKWSAIWDSNILLSKEELMEAFIPPLLEDGTKSPYGFGWVIIDDTTYMHDGRWLASNSIIIKKKEEDSLFIMIDNSTNIRFEKILKELNKYTDTYKHETIKEEILYN